MTVPTTNGERQRRRERDIHYLVTMERTDARATDHRASQLAPTLARASSTVMWSESQTPTSRVALSPSLSSSTPSFPLAVARENFSNYRRRERRRRGRCAATTSRMTVSHRGGREREVGEEASSISIRSLVGVLCHVKRNKVQTREGALSNKSLKYFSLSYGHGGDPHLVHQTKLEKHSVYSVEFGSNE